MNKEKISSLLNSIQSGSIQSDRSGTSNVNCTDDKQNYMRQFNNKIQEYLRTHSESTVNALNRSLSLLSSSMNLKQFDPESVEASNFYVNLYRLMSTLDARAALVWSAVAVVQHCIKNSNARHALIHKFRFVPVIAKLLTSINSHDRLMKVLQLLQDITYGIKITWQEPYLAELIQQLVEHIDGTDEKLITISLSVLINLCYKNLPSIYVLMRTVNTTNLTAKIKPYGILACKMYLILEAGMDEIQKQDLHQFIKFTFIEIEKALRKWDVILMRHIVDFFVDTKNQKNMNNSFIDYDRFAEDIECVLKSIESKMNADECAKLIKMEDVGRNEPECMSMVFELINSIIVIDKKLAKIYPQITDLSLQWLPSDKVNSKALEVLKNIVCYSADAEQGDSLLDKIANHVPLLVTLTDRFEIPAEQTKALLQLLSVMSEKPKLQPKILGHIRDEFFGNIFNKIINSNPEYQTFCKTTSTEVAMYLHAINLLTDFARLIPSIWTCRLETVMCSQPMHFLIAKGMLSEDADICNLVFKLSKTEKFPAVEVSRILVNQGPLLVAKQYNFPTNNDFMLVDALKSSPVNAGMEDRLNDLINRLLDARNKNEIGNALMSEVMELFEYKIAMCNNNERDLHHRLEEASNQITGLSHRIALLSSEVSKYQSMNFSLQLSHEKMKEDHSKLLKEGDTFNERIKEINSKLQVETKKLNRSMKLVDSKKTEIDTLTAEIERYKAIELQHANDVSRLESNNNELRQRNEDLNQCLECCEKSLIEKKATIEMKDNKIQDLRKDLEETKLDNIKLEENLKTTKKQLNDREDVIATYEKEFKEIEDLRNTVVRLMQSSTAKGAKDYSKKSTKLN